MESIYEIVSMGDRIPSFSCSSVVSTLKNKKYLSKNQNISTLEVKGNSLFETLGSGYPLAQPNVAQGNVHLIRLNHSLHHLWTR